MKTLIAIRKVVVCFLKFVGPFRSFCEAAPLDAVPYVSHQVPKTHGTIPPYPLKVRMADVTTINMSPAYNVSCVSTTKWTKYEKAQRINQVLVVKIA